MRYRVDFARWLLLATGVWHLAVVYRVSRNGRLVPGVKFLEALDATS